MVEFGLIFAGFIIVVAFGILSKNREDIGWQ